MSGLEEGLKSNLQVIVGLVLMLKFLESLSRLSSFERRRGGRVLCLWGLTCLRVQICSVRLEKVALSV